MHLHDVSRVEFHQIVPLIKKTTEATRSALNLAMEVPVRRLEFRVGKMSLPDSFDLNSVGSDSHLQFTNWTIDNNGAYDYAADTRGYTYGFRVGWNDGQHDEFAYTEVDQTVALDGDYAGCRWGRALDRVGLASSAPP